MRVRGLKSNVVATTAAPAGRRKSQCGSDLPFHDFSAWTRWFILCPLLFALVGPFFLVEIPPVVDYPNT